MVPTPNPQSQSQQTPVLTINDLANIIKNNSDSVVGKMTEMEGRLGKKMDDQEAKLSSVWTGNGEGYPPPVAEHRLETVLRKLLFTRGEQW